MSNTRREKPERPAQCSSGDRPGRRCVGLAGLILVVAATVTAAHWPALSARALPFDDHQFLTDNPLVRNPGWASAGRFFSEVLEPSTVEGYYLPLSMISLMLDYATGGRPDHPQPFHRTSLALHVLNTAFVAVVPYSLFGQYGPEVTATRLQ